MKILGIETSCDDTGIAIYDSVEGIIYNKLYSQSYFHNFYGGVVPELASRKHLEVLAILIKDMFVESGIDKRSIDAIAYTAGPGLVGSLLVGASLSTALAFSLNIPTILVNHMEGHLLTPMIEQKKLQFPFVGLLVSGGHTQLINAYDIGKYELLGESLDDAVGETFDKIAKLLGLSYPGGPSLSKLAQSGILGTFNFPRPMIHRMDLNFSFSGLKTFVTNIIKMKKHNFQTQANIAKEFEHAVTDVLVNKSKRALEQLNYATLVVSGGVSMNSMLRYKLDGMIKCYKGQVFYPKLELCGDNGAMIAHIGMLRFKESSYDLNISVYPKWSITDLKPI
ncbi:tRNA (adenosine(37)-N6)-threonylcarbamoyltransferase complex transferase subunit TsaD [Buchnera aphidicola]|uniref:tRNA N6-adenosine threonylcarbamoyltransferase n=1 Tax=Buchnera aphidicola subsp. Melaphis rhois TaxID=118103 RepID=A0A4D6YAB1_BUCMH|nr:tRNA (adenosine(37)-N6)-threonylcarbamoyltransferase complex transferase subunit TsaD [Buchnera aphidicola]QCI23098.1 tRNA (adenosine(37)-N6)-threonylcarbamoyltransferase complex transferase subunit TsaD [Buchnera aphidicola (Melaphis rhois)]